MTTQPPTRASERIARRRELRQARLLEVQRRRAQRARLRVALAVVVLLLLGLLAWFGIAMFVTPAAAFAGGMPSEASAVVALLSRVELAVEIGKETWRVFS
ncbi:MAG: hypothetical protein RMM58_13090 [Chloroflexota bacterium]|nr:hypothetical protein [Dehalococcoidia bacterium]MDW8254806.1 hypothetical protein [Chloroflexota bacterium]